MDYNIFLRTIKFADYYRTTKTNIYFFIKDCLFQRIFKVYGNRFPSSDCQNLFNIFQICVQRYYFLSKKPNLFSKTFGI